MLKEFPHYHYDSPVKDAHVQSLVEFFQSGCVTRDNYGIGVEIEHLPVRVGTDEAVGYTDEHGIRDVLHDLAPLYDESREYYEDGHLLGLGRGKIA
nr:gamma-glutamylcysteine synthetase [Alloscardovia omnicolens]